MTHRRVVLFPFANYPKSIFLLYIFNELCDTYIIDTYK